jgi:protein-disulfide isomerase
MAEETKDPKTKNDAKVTIGVRSLLIIAIVVSLFVGYAAGNIAPIFKVGTGTGTGTGTQTTTTTPNQLVQFSLPSYETPQGQSGAKINLIEFADYQCPYCTQFFSSTEPSIMQNYVNSGKIKYYFFDFAFLGPDSQTLAEGAWCANDQGLFWQYHDYIYSHQGQENSGWANATQVEALATNIQGLNMQQFSQCLDSAKYLSRVQQLTTQAQNVGVTGTPAFLIGNDKQGYTVVVGALPYSSFQTTLDSILAKA